VAKLFLKPISWACSNIKKQAQQVVHWLLWLAMLLAGLTPVVSAASITEPTSAAQIRSHVLLPPGDDMPWQTVQLPHNRRPPLLGAQEVAIWYRIAFDAPASEAERKSWSVYIPYLRDGGRIFLNGSAIEYIAESSPALRVKWERPHLVTLPDNLLRAGSNVLSVRTLPALDVGFPKLGFGSTTALRPWQDRRQFWVLTMPQITVGGCLVIAALTLLIWWHRRTEQLYGLFGLSVLFWGLRTVNLVIETLPIDYWWTWRLIYHASTGGFIFLLALFVLRFANLFQKPVVWRLLLAYWLICPIAMLLFGIAADVWLHKLWSAGFVPMGLTAVAVIFYAAWQKRDFAAYALLVGMLLAVISGIHDYLLLVGWLVALLPEWDGHHIFLLHHGANVMLLMMGGILTQRFIQVLFDLENLNHHLELRVADRETKLAAQYQRTQALERERAAVEERCRIMRDMHDGLGSQLFQSLSRAERGNLTAPEMAESLQNCINEMRLALEAQGTSDDSFLEVLADFRFRWERQLRQAGIQSIWHIEAAVETLKFLPQTTLQYLRILQEALTNVLKHARASQVRVHMAVQDKSLCIQIEDDGIGLGEGAAGPGHGLGNMRQRAGLLGARLHINSRPGCTRVELGGDPVTNAV